MKGQKLTSKHLIAQTFCRLGKEARMLFAVLVISRKTCRFGILIVTWLATECLMFAFPQTAVGVESNFWAYIGTYTGGGHSKGIYISLFDALKGEFSAPELAFETRNPSFLAVHPTRPLLYAVAESDSVIKGQGAVSSFRMDTATGKLELVNKQPSGGTGPCHLSVDRTGKCLLIANYNNGSVEILGIKPNGELAPPNENSIIQHRGSSVNKQRQAGPHAHFIVPDPANKFALACDLGLDKVLIYRLDLSGPQLVPNHPPSGSVDPGSGPRHLVFSQGGKFVYAVNEMGSSVSVFKYGSKEGKLEQFQTISTLPEKFEGHNTCAEIQIHPSGKWVYASNRGHDSIAIFSADRTGGKLRAVGNCLTEGKTPRHFALAPGGKWLIAENQDSNSLVTFAVDPESGAVRLHGKPLEIGAPVCLVFVPISAAK
jgi:6-phosphogluconolactonase